MSHNNIMVLGEVHSSPVPSLSSNSSHKSYSSPPSSIQSVVPGEDEEDAAWGLMDALYFRTARDPANDNETLSISHALVTDLDGSAFGMRSPSEDGSIRSGSRTSSYDEMDIPNFPELSLTLLQGEWRPSEEEKEVPRTSEPISVGVKEDREGQLTGLVNRELFQELLDAPMGLVRFREWVEEEGLPGSKALLQFHQDARAYSGLVDEVQAITQGMQSLYFGPKAVSHNSLPQIASRPSDCLPALTSASLGMHTAQAEAFDRLYAAEFKRFIAGKMSAAAKSRLELFPAHQERGDLGEVFCVANPRLPDQPLVLVSDAFCRLSEYPRERLVGRNCRFLQGPATDPEAVRLLREAIAAGKEHCSLLLNYTRTGKPFWNLLNMIPLRNASGRIDFFIGAQVDVSKGLTSRKAFEALTGIVKRDERSAARVAAKLAFSEALINNTENISQRPVALRQLSASSTDDLPIKAAVPTVATVPPVREVATPKKQRWLAQLKPKSSEPALSNKASVADIPPAAPILQDLPDPVREHMATFSSAYSNLLIFGVNDRRIIYITAPLLAHLGYSVKSSRDRLSPSLINTDFIDLLVARNLDEASLIRSTVRKVINERQTHSLFAGIALAQSRRTASMPEEAIDGILEDGRKFTRSLLHMTPLKDGKDVTHSYVVVVG